MPESSFEARTLYTDDDRTVALIVLNGVNERVRNSRSCTWYEVLSGTGRFDVSYPDHKSWSIEVSRGLVVMIPRGAVYQDQGNYLVMLATSIPPFDPATVETL